MPFVIFIRSTWPCDDDHRRRIVIVDHRQKSRHLKWSQSNLVDRGWAALYVILAPSGYRIYRSNVRCARYTHLSLSFHSFVSFDDAH